MILFGSEDKGVHSYVHSFLKMHPSLKAKILTPKEPISFLQSKKIEQFKIILTGSSYGDNTIDKKLWKLASSSGLRSVAIIEHWSWYIERFQEDKQLILPDQIIVNDSLAYDDAVKSGLPMNKLKIIGNPHFRVSLQKPHFL
jgi:hypothetical protein